MKDYKFIVIEDTLDKNDYENCLSVNKFENEDSLRGHLIELSERTYERDIEVYEISRKLNYKVNKNFSYDVELNSTT